MRRHDQKGLAAIVISVILVALLSAVAVSFAVIMNREMQKAVNNQLGQAAYDAAASGINDAISFVRDNPTTNIANCTDLIGAGKPLSAASNLSSDGSTKYTCVLINTLPLDLAYQNIPAYQSQVVLVNGTSKMSKIMLSWQSTIRTHNQYIPAFPADQLFDETTWAANKYEPLLRVSLYPVPADTKDASYASTNSKTFFLYPTQATGFAVDNLDYSTASGTLDQVECGLSNTNGQFNGSADYDCNLIINNLPSADPSGYLYYVRVTPMYQAADVKIRADDSTPAYNPVGFMNAQAIIDVTAQSANAVKRLQARVDISGLNAPSQNIAPSDNNFSEYALRQPITVCKRLVNAGSNFPAYIDGSALGYCGSDVSNFKQLQPPVVSASCTPQDSTTANCSGTVDPNNGTVSSCTWSLSPGGQSSSCPGTATHSTTPYSVSWSISGLTGGTSYTAQLCASNQAGPGCTNASFSTPSPPPPVGQTVFVQTGWSVTINGYGPGLNNCDFFASGTPTNPGPWLSSWYPIDKSYANSHSYGSANYPQGSSAGLIHCKAISGADGWSGQVPQVPSVQITFFNITGPLNNPNPKMRYCPDDYHLWVDCIRWAVVTSPSSNVALCYVKYTSPSPPGGGTTNSPLEIGSGGWTVGSFSAGYLTGWASISCTGTLGGSDAINNLGPAPACTPTSDPNCLY